MLAIAKWKRDKKGGEMNNFQTLLSVFISYWRWRKTLVDVKLIYWGLLKENNTAC